jgi:hypothetical protein
MPLHTNCHDIQAEAQREYGLTPDDVHDSFNFFMHTGIDQAGHPYIADNVSKKGDFVEVMALIDVLAVPNVCGSDIQSTSNFELKPLRLVVKEGDPELLEKHCARAEMRPLTTQRNPSQFLQPNIKADRELHRNPAYKPQWGVYPLIIEEVPVPLDDTQLAKLDQLVATGEFGDTRADALRYVFFSWWMEHFVQGPKHFDREAVL